MVLRRSSNIRQEKYLGYSVVLASLYHMAVI